MPLIVAVFVNEPEAVTVCAAVVHVAMWFSLFGFGVPRVTAASDALHVATTPAGRRLSLNTRLDRGTSPVFSNVKR